MYLIIFASGGITR